MPTIASVTVTFSRKYQIRKDNWVGLEAQVTMRVDEAEASLVDPQSVIAEAFYHARAAIVEQQETLRREIAEAQARVEEQRRLDAQAEPEQSQPSLTNGDSSVSTPPTTAAEAKRRFYARYGEAIGDDTWAAVQRYLGKRLPEPVTIDEWYSAAAAVRARMQQEAPTTNGRP